MDRDQARALLGLNEDASDAEIKRAYRDLMRTVHPDKHGGDPAATRLAVLANEAKDALLAAAEVRSRSHRSTARPPWDEPERPAREEGPFRAAPGRTPGAGPSAGASRARPRGAEPSGSAAAKKAAEEGVSILAELVRRSRNFAAGVLIVASFVPAGVFGLGIIGGLAGACSGEAGSVRWIFTCIIGIAVSLVTGAVIGCVVAADINDLFKEKENLSVSEKSALIIGVILGFIVLATILDLLA